MAIQERWRYDLGDMTLERGDGGGGRRTRFPYPGSATALQGRRREKDPGSRPGIYNPQKW
jgi:hypothetical protein